MIKGQTIEHPAAWHVDELGGKETLAHDLTRAQVDALMRATEGVSHLDAEQIQQQDFDLGAISADVSGWLEEIRHGKGIVLLRGVPTDQLDVDDCCRLFYGLGTHLGIAVSQSNMGEKLGHVVNLGGQDRRHRAYQNARRLGMHTDRCDVVGMLCIRPAEDGGLSGYSSALTIHNEMLLSKPELVAPLYEGFRLHRFGEQKDDEKLTPMPVPVFSYEDGHYNVVYIRGYIDLAIDEGHYALTELQQAALDYFDELSLRDDINFETRLEAGEATLTNNALLLHRRTAFSDSADPELRRHLLRLWLMDETLPAVPAVRMHKSLAGIEKLTGRQNYYRGPGYAGS